MAQLRAFLTWWQALGPRPLRWSLNPVDLGVWLNRIVLLRRVGPDDFVYRICGEDVIGFLGRNPTGESVWAITRHDPSRHRIPSRLAAIATHRQPVAMVARHVSVDGYRRESWTCAVPFFHTADDCAEVSDVLALPNFIPDPPPVDGVVFGATRIDTPDSLDRFFDAYVRDGLDMPGVTSG